MVEQVKAAGLLPVPKGLAAVDVGAAIDAHDGRLRGRIRRRTRHLLLRVHLRSVERQAQCPDQENAHPHNQEQNRLPALTPGMEVFGNSIDDDPLGYASQPNSERKIAGERIVRIDDGDGNQPPGKIGSHRGNSR